MMLPAGFAPLRLRAAQGGGHRRRRFGRRHTLVDEGQARSEPAPRGRPAEREHGRVPLSLVTILGIAVGLAMDAFAVAIGVGLNAGRVSGRTTFRLAWHFGLFQFLMPVVGWLAGLSVEQWISGVDHWVAFGLLVAIGGHMLYEAFRGDEERSVRDPTRGASLVVLSVATSIDALAVGLSLALLGTDIWYPAVIIGVVAFAFTAAGLHLGSRFGARLGKRVEALGGVILIGIGVRILLDHLF